MVEGGARVIQSFLSSGHLVDALIVTTAPVLVGSDGVGYSNGATGSGSIYIDTRLLGRDTVVGLKITS
jgi:2,5-diamino-6-(ribosylamino)-4(3H)-pyrimidinone 5'-phosphate reductase